METNWLYNTVLNAEIHVIFVPWVCRCMGFVPEGVVCLPEGKGKTL